jgi:hypothetical protein
MGKEREGSEGKVNENRGDGGKGATRGNASMTPFG